MKLDFNSNKELKKILLPHLRKGKILLEQKIREYESEVKGEEKPKTERQSNVLRQETLTFKEIADWASKHQPDNADSMSVVKDKSTDSEYQFVVCLVYMKNGKALIDDSYPSLFIHCNRFDDTLYESFGDNDVIILE